MNVVIPLLLLAGLALGTAAGASKPSASKPSASKPSASKPSASKPAAPKPSASKPAEVLAAELVDAQRASKPAAPKPSAPKRVVVDIGPARMAPEPAPRVEPRKPDGYDRTRASAMAPALARHIAQKAYNYDRGALRAWQRAAGLKVDGIYGPATASELRSYDARAPKPLFKGASNG